MARTSASPTLLLFQRSLPACLALSSLKEVDSFHVVWDETIIQSFHIFYAKYCILLTINFSNCHAF